MRKRAVVLAVAVAVAVLAAAAVPRLVSVETYRPRVAAAILESTGRNASFSKISLAVFPFVAIRLSDFSMAGPPGAPGEALVSAPAAEIRLALLPLLAGRGEPRALVLRRPQIVVRKFRDGSTSAADMFGRLAAQAGSARIPVTAVRVEDGRLTVVFEEEDAPESRLEF